MDVKDCETTSAANIADGPRANEDKNSLFGVKTDPDQGDRATELKIWSCSRPHMLSFHLAWLGFFTSFLAWFSFAPLMPLVKKAFKLTKHQIWVANICSVLSTIGFRFIVGPLCDRFGARLMMAGILIIFSIPVFVGGFVVNSGSSLAVARFFIGGVGAVFVPCQYWVSSMFASNIVGTAQAVAGGWGNLGGAVTQIMMVKIYDTLHRRYAIEKLEGQDINDPNKAWRSAFTIPAMMMVVVGIMIIFLGQDGPAGQYRKLQSTGQMKKAKMLDAIKTAMSFADTWILFVQYAVSFGMELTVNNLATTYFQQHFKLSLYRSAAIATAGGVMNVWARACGGIVSDAFHKSSWMNKGNVLRGRILWLWVVIAVEGCLLLGFSQAETLTNSKPLFIFFEIFVFMGCGATYGLVPYVAPEVKGAVTGVIGAGGNVGGVLWGLCFLYGPQLDRKCLYMLGWIVFGCSFLCIFLRFPNEQLPAMVEKGKSQTPKQDGQEPKTASCETKEDPESPSDQ